MKATPVRYHAKTHIRYRSKCNVAFASSFSLSNMTTKLLQWRRKVVNSGGLISQQEKFSMVKIESYGGLLK